jgi:hypothetical protein
MQRLHEADASGHKSPQPRWFRTLEQLGCARSQGNQALQRRSEVSLALLMPLDAHRNLGLPLFQLARFFVVFVRFSFPSPRTADASTIAPATALATSSCAFGAWSIESRPPRDVRRSNPVSCARRWRCNQGSVQYRSQFAASFQKR